MKKYKKTLSEVRRKIINSFHLTGMAVAFISNQQTKDSISSSIIESPESQDLAQKLSSRLKKPVFMSSNTNLDRITKQQLEQRLIKEIEERPEYFWTVEHI